MSEAYSYAILTNMNSFTTQYLNDQGAYYNANIKIKQQEIQRLREELRRQRERIRALDVDLRFQEACLNIWKSKYLDWVRGWTPEYRAIGMGGREA